MRERVTLAQAAVIRNVFIAAGERDRLEGLASALGLLSLGGSDCHFRPGWPALGDGGLDEPSYRRFQAALESRVLKSRP